MSDIYTCECGGKGCGRRESEVFDEGFSAGRAEGIKENDALIRRLYVALERDSNHLLRLSATINEIRGLQQTLAEAREEGGDMGETLEKLALALAEAP